MAKLGARNISPWRKSICSQGHVQPEKHIRLGKRGTRHKSDQENTEPTCLTRKLKEGCNMSAWGTWVLDMSNRRTWGRDMSTWGTWGLDMSNRRTWGRDMSNRETLSLYMPTWGIWGQDMSNREHGAGTC